MKRTKLQTILLHTLIIISILIVSLPVILSFIISTQTPVEVYSSPPKVLPSAYFENYAVAWRSVSLGRMMLNSTIIAAAVTAGKIVFSLLAAFAFTYFAFKGKNFLFFVVIITLLLPIPVRIVALFGIVSSFGADKKFRTRFVTCLIVHIVRVNIIT